MPCKTMVAIETPRLILRHFSYSDQSGLEPLLCDPVVMRFSLGVKSADEIEAWLDDRLASYERNPNVGLFAVTLKPQENLIGYCGFLEYQDLGGCPETEIGYRLIQEQWGHGYATEAAGAVRDFGFEHLKRQRLVSLIDPQNLRSIAVAQKIGMRFEKEVMLAGYTHPDHVYSIEKNIFNNNILQTNPNPLCEPVAPEHKR